MVGVERGSLKLVLPLLDLEASVLLADDVELADHVDVADQVVGVDVEGHDLLAALVPPHALLEVQLALGRPPLVRV